MLGHHMQALRETIGGKGDYKGKETRKLVMQVIYIKKEMGVKERRRRSTLLMPTKIKGCELDVTNRQLFRGCNGNNLSESRTTTENNLTRHPSGRLRRKKEVLTGMQSRLQSSYTIILQHTQTNINQSTNQSTPQGVSNGKGKGGGKMLTLSI